MVRFFRCLLVVLWLLAAPLPVGAQSIRPEAGVVPPGMGLASINTTMPAGYYDGMIEYSTITNCFSIIQGTPYQEYGAGAFVGYHSDPQNARPTAGEVYYIHVYVAGLGNPCSGTYFYVDVALPPNTNVVISNANPVYCLFNGVSSPADCPLSLPASSYHPGAFEIPANNPAHANLWPLPQGKTIEFQIPVVSSTTLSNAQMQANIWTIDGNSSPWLAPHQGVYVFGGFPTITYPQPSTTTITSTTGHSVAYLYDYGGVGGTGNFDIGTTQSYGFSEPATIPAGGATWLAFDDWGPPFAVSPNTTYHWRFRYKPTGGNEIFGVDQSFTTAASGTISLGMGASTACTETDLNSALANPTTTQINIDCGLAPTTIMITSSHDVSSNLTIKGTSQLILEFSGSGDFFNVLSGGHLTLDQLTLRKGNNPGCGGAVNVASGANLTVTNVHFDGNHSNSQGGAICNNGTTTISGARFTSNTSNSHGGAIGSYGSLILSNSSFSANISDANGGAIDMGGQATVSTSNFDSNIAGYRGGGINTYGGTLIVSTSTFRGNSASIWGGGIASDASNTTINSSTLSGNTTPGVGGGIEISGVGSVSLTNSTLHGNSASGNGGGIAWDWASDPLPATLTLLNTTIAFNSGAAGGSIYAGGTATSLVHLTNTIINNGSPNNCNAALGTLGHNLENTNTCGFNASGDLINTAPKLAALQNYGGLTQTRALQAGSPAINAGTNSGCPATDQRGKPRPVGASCDIGAFETQANTPTLTDLSASGLEDQALALTQSDFAAHISLIDNGPLAKIKVTSLPVNGSLKLNNTAVSLNQEILAANLSGLTFHPSANWNGSTSFTWKGSDGNLYSAAAATVNITTQTVNDAPSFTKGANINVSQPGVVKTVGGWATNISPGPADEAAQTISFLVSNNANSLFETQPALGKAGTLIFKPAANHYGTATVTVRIKDNGGIANGGADTSAPQTFTISVLHSVFLPVLVH